MRVRRHTIASISANSYDQCELPIKPGLITFAAQHLQRSKNSGEDQRVSSVPSLRPQCARPRQPIASVPGLASNSSWEHLDELTALAPRPIVARTFLGKSDCYSVCFILKKTRRPSV